MLITVVLGEVGLRIYNSVDPLPIFMTSPTIDFGASRLRWIGIFILSAKVRVGLRYGRPLLLLSPSISAQLLSRKQNDMR